MSAALPPPYGPWAWYTFALAPHSAFATPLKGDTLFGQICATLAQQQGSAWLTQALGGYTEGAPFAVVSDAFPAGFLPKPKLPAYRLGAAWTQNTPEARNLAKKHTWVPISPAQLAAYQTTDVAALWRQAENVAAEDLAALGVRHDVQMHNTLSRLTGTTGTSGNDDDDAGGAGEFAPFHQMLDWLPPRLEVHVVLAEAVCTPETFEHALRHIGQWGYGKKASAGLGKFEVLSRVRNDFSPSAPYSPSASANTASAAPLGGAQNQRHPPAWWTLAPCAPQNLGFAAHLSSYTLLTRFGRHGGGAAVSNPFKKPILLADTAALFALPHGDTHRLFVGQGLRGMSAAQPEAVHQGYAPALPCWLPEHTTTSAARGDPT